MKTRKPRPPALLTPYEAVLSFLRALDYNRGEEGADEIRRIRAALAPLGAELEAERIAKQEKADEPTADDRDEAEVAVAG